MLAVLKRYRDVEYGAAPFTPTGTPSVGYDDLTTAGATITGLTANTAYEWYVRADCGGDNSNVSGWIGPFTFSTACVSETIPWAEGFEGLTPVGAGIVPDCMAEVGDWTSADAASPTTYNRGPRTGTNYMTVNYTANDWLFTPPFDLVAGTPYDFVFWYKTDGLSGWTTIEAGYGTGQTAVDMVNFIGTPVSNATNLTYQEYRASFTPATTGTYYMGIHVVATGIPWYLSFDDLGVEPGPNCLPPISLNTTNITTAAADLNWTAGLNETLWDVEYGPAGFTPAGTPSSGYDDLTTTTAALTGLSGATSYDWYVRADCNGDNIDVSTWSGPISFTTECVPFPPFAENFDGVTAPNMPVCWTSVVGNTLNTFAAVGTYALTLHPPNLIMCVDTLSADTAELYIISPQLASPAEVVLADKTIRFSAYNTSTAGQLQDWYHDSSNGCR